ncbi:MAG: hypothetical protein PSN34_13745 [Urechidicola sp.]|nr:hypothetical protein [Urechidicola sp.]
MNKIIQTLLFTFSLFLMIGCGSNVKLKNSWQDDTIGIIKTEKVLIVNKSKREGIRQRGEREIANVLKAKGVDAVESFVAFPYLSVNATRTEEEIAKVLQQFLDAGYEAVLITRLKDPSKQVSTTTRITEEDKQKSETDEFFETSSYGKYPVTFGVYFNDTEVPNRTPGPDGLEETTDNYSEVFELETVTYHIKPGQEKLLGSVTIDITDPEDIMGTLEKYAGLVANQLK